MNASLAKVRNIVRNTDIMDMKAQKRIKRMKKEDTHEKQRVITRRKRLIDYDDVEEKEGNSDKGRQIHLSMMTQERERETVIKDTKENKRFSQYPMVSFASVCERENQISNNNKKRKTILFKNDRVIKISV